MTDAPANDAHYEPDPHETEAKTRALRRLAHVLDGTVSVDTPEPFDLASEADLLVRVFHSAWLKDMPPWYPETLMDRWYRDDWYGPYIVSVFEVKQAWFRDWRRMLDQAAQANDGPGDPRARIDALHDMIVDISNMTPIPVLEAALENARSAQAALATDFRRSPAELKMASDTLETLIQMIQRSLSHTEQYAPQYEVLAIHPLDSDDPTT